MELMLALLPNALCAAGTAAMLAVVFTAPPRYVLPSFACGLAALLARDLLAASGMNVHWATAVASAGAVIAAAAVTPEHAVVPVVLIAAVLPLGAAVAVFTAMIELLRVSSVEGAALVDASVKLSASLGKAFTTFVAIALGLQIGVAAVRAARHEQDG
ncbi:MAG TPA: hypothetical protein VFA59_23930 [Vicinamibacterales bacterium]|nr:hypothetical protein [Vicinamibacterales bacterium]